MSEPSPLPARADVVIIGGGIVGCAAAYHLAGRGLGVVLLERGDIAGEQSSRAWGFVRKQGRHPAELPLAREASLEWPTLGETLGADLEYVTSGIMSLAETEADLAKLTKEESEAKAAGLSTRLITRAEIAGLIPGIAGKWKAGLYTPDDGHAEPGKATKALAAAAQARGATIATGCGVDRIELTGGRVGGVATTRGRIEAPVVLCCAGIEGPRFARALGVNVPVRVVRSSVCETNAAPISSRIAVWAPTVAYRPTGRGTYRIGNGYRGIGADYDITLDSFRNLRHFLPVYLKNYDKIRLRLNGEFFSGIGEALSGTRRALPEPQANLAKIAYNESQLYELLPATAGAGLARRWSGRIDMTPDMIPAIGPVGNTGAFLAFGFSGHGFAIGPVAGRLLSEWIVDGKPSLDLSAFRVDRFQRCTAEERAA